MIVLCTGAESTGTRLASRLVEQMGAEALHRSVPHGGREAGERHWPALSRLQWDAAVVMTRDWWAAVPSQLTRHVETEKEAWHNLQRAYAELTRQLQRSGKPWRFVSYESLVARPQVVVENIAEWLGLHTAGVTEEIRDGNEKWLR